MTKILIDWTEIYVSGNVQPLLELKHISIEKKKKIPVSQMTISTSD